MGVYIEMEFLICTADMQYLKKWWTYSIFAQGQSGFDKKKKSNCYIVFPLMIHMVVTCQFEALPQISKNKTCKEDIHNWLIISNDFNLN